MEIGIASLKRRSRSVKAHPWLSLLTVISGFYLLPQSYSIIRIFLVVAFPALWISGVFILLKRKWLAIPILFVGLAFAAFICTPGSAPDSDILRKAYVKSLERYKGTLYIWGGENRIGIDCSCGLKSLFISLGGLN